MKNKEINKAEAYRQRLDAVLLTPSVSFPAPHLKPHSAQCRWRKLQKGLDYFPYNPNPIAESALHRHHCEDVGKMQGRRNMSLNKTTVLLSSSKITK